MCSEGYSTRSVCLSVCLSWHFLPLCAMKQQNSNTNRLLAATTGSEVTMEGEYRLSSHVMPKTPYTSIYHVLPDSVS